MAIQLVVFDMAGTTVDDRGVVNRCFRETLALNGLAVRPEAVDAVMGLRKPDAFRELLGQTPSPLASALLEKIDIIHADFVERMIDFYANDPGVKEIPGTTALFQFLKETGVKVTLDTGFSRDIADTILKRLGWVKNGLVDASVTSDEVINARPHADMINKLMAECGVTDPKSVAKVGDAPADLEEGFSAHCRWVIGVTWGSHTRAQLERCPYTHLVDRVDELKEILAGGIESGEAYNV